MTTRLDSWTGSLGRRGVRGSPSSFFLLATWQASSLRGDGQSRLSFQSVLGFPQPVYRVRLWQFLSPAEHRVGNAAQLSSFRQTLLFIGEPRFYFCIEPNVSRSARTPGTFATGMKLLSNAAIDLNESMFSKQRVNCHDAIFSFNAR